MNSETTAKDDHLASILMELTMQYAKLTDAHTFLLIDSPTSRKFAGKQHLKDLYRRGELKPCGKDSEITVDTDLTQMIEVKTDGEQNEEKDEGKEDQDQESSASSDVGFLPRRHIGELPSERRQRMRNEKKTYNKLVNMSYKTEESFGTFLMEALMKFSCMNDANIFFLIETNRERRFTGETHLCEQYMEGNLRPTGDDVEMEIDASIRVMTERRIAKPREDVMEADESVRSAKSNEEEEGDEKLPEEGSERKRKESEASMDSSDQPVKRRQAAHVGLLPSERREHAAKERAAKFAAENPPPPPPPPESPTMGGGGGGEAGRKHKGELPSERRERMRLEREAEENPYKYDESKVQSGPGYICGPSAFPSGYGQAATMEGMGYPDGSYGWGANAGGYDATYASGYAEGGYGYKPSYGNWKSGGTMQSGAKSSKSHSQYGW